MTDRHGSGLHKGPSGFLGTRNCRGALTDRTGVAGGVGIAVARGGEVRVEQRTSRLRARRGQRTAGWRLWFVQGRKQREMGTGWLESRLSSIVGLLTLEGFGNNKQNLLGASYMPDAVLTIHCRICQPGHRLHFRDR